MTDQVCINHGCGMAVLIKRYQLCRRCYRREFRTGLKTPEQKALELENAALLRGKHQPKTRHQELHDCAMQLISTAHQTFGRELITAALGDGFFWIKNEDESTLRFKERWLLQARNASKYFHPKRIGNV